MAQQKLGSLVARERKRLEKRRDELSAKKAAIDSELSDIDRNLAAANAYESALSTQARAAASATATRKKRAKKASAKKKAAKGRAKTKARATSKAPARKAGTRRPRRGSRREAIVEVISKAAGGATRGDILEAMGVKGDKAAEQAVSNALTAMKKAGRISSTDGKYHV